MDGIAVAVGRIARLARGGLVDDLRIDPRIRVLADNLDASSLEAIVAQGVVHVAVLDEAAVQSASLLTAIAPSIGLLVLAREPSPVYGRALVASGVSCLDWDVASEDVRAAVRLAVDGGCMFVSRDDRVNCSDWRVESLLSKRERAVLSRHIEGNSYEQIALALKISRSTAKNHTASARRKLGASSRRELMGIPMLMRDPSSL